MRALTLSVLLACSIAGTSRLHADSKASRPSRPDPPCLSGSGAAEGPLHLRLRGGALGRGNVTAQPSRGGVFPGERVSKPTHRSPLKIGAFTVRDAKGAPPVMIDSAEFVCFDTETTGLDPATDDIIEIAAARFTLRGGISRTFHSLVAPPGPIPNAQVHGITDEMVQGAPNITAVLPGFLAFVDNATVVGHSVHFDVGMVRAAAARCGLGCALALGRHVDTSRLARHYGGSANFSLAGMLEHFNRSAALGEKQGMHGHHRALGDVRSNVEVFVALCKPYRTLGQLFDLLSRPVRLKTLPFGKHRGERIAEVPRQYLEWCAKSMRDWDEDLKHTIEDELARRSCR